MNGLRDMLNEFYENIPEWLRQPLIDSINSAEIANEDHIVTPLSNLIINLERGLNTVAVNRYMTDPVTRHSVTRRFFFPHTLPGNLYPEDRDIYVPPPPPAGLDRLVLAPSPALPLDFRPRPQAGIISGADLPSQVPPPFVIPPSYLLPLSAEAEAFAADPDDDFFNELSPRASPLSMPVHHPVAPPRIDSFFQPGVAQAIAAMAYQVPDPLEAQAPRVAPRTLPNDLEEGEIYE